MKEDGVGDACAALGAKERPEWPKPTSDSVRVALVRQVESRGGEIVSFGMPFPPDVLWDDGAIRVFGEDGEEIPAFTAPLAHWRIDGSTRGLRSVLIQFEALPGSGREAGVTVTWKMPRAKRRTSLTPIWQTQTAMRVEPPAEYHDYAESFEYRWPRVLALLPPEWLCESLVAWQQVPAKANALAPWFDRHFEEHFENSLVHVSAKTATFHAHLFDRPTVYLKAYVRSGEARHLEAGLSSLEFYLQHIGEDGFFDLKPAKDHKYLYTEGAALAYMLTGDERYRAAAEGIIRTWDGYANVEYAPGRFWTERHHGFGMAAYVHAYEATGEARYLERARWFFEAALEVQRQPADGGPPDGAFLHTAGDHSEHGRKGWISSPWMSAFLADAIWKYWMLTGDRRCPSTLAAYADFIRKHAITPDGRGVYYLAASPGRGESVVGDSPAHNMEGIYFLAMGHYLSGGTQATFLEKIEPLVAPLVADDANSPARKFSWRFRETSMLLWFLANGGARQKTI